MIKLCSFTWFLSHFFMFLLRIIKENAPGGGVLAHFYRLGGWGFELFFCPGGGESAHQKNCPGGDGQAWNWLIHYGAQYPKTQASCSGNSSQTVLRPLSFVDAFMMLEAQEFWVQSHSVHPFQVVSLRKWNKSTANFDVDFCRPVLPRNQSSTYIIWIWDLCIFNLYSLWQSWSNYIRKKPH